ncbi:uncharacterized protein LOC116603329 [Nematostella vectensis]|uniref:Insulin-like prepropeptide ILP3 n=1 Tax=Nematostella vectensis TaxID=45351 RepID=A0A1T4JGZ2_NEMVE|nr:uncharacterized protein LOC116603329 [Nematostella vectensis]SJX71957.1 Insulin-like prepropeptide ILP3 [Nematostella vectensis]
MKTCGILVVLAVFASCSLVSEVSGGPRWHGKKYLCNGDVDKWFKIICKPHTGTHVYYPGKRSIVESQDANEANLFLKPMREKRNIHEECCKEGCTYHEIQEVC